MPETQMFARTDFQTHAPLPQMESGWHRETLIENHMNKPIFVMQATGDILEVAPLYKSSHFGQRVLVKQIQRVGLPQSDVGIISGRPTIASPKNSRSDFEVTAKQLSFGPVYIKEVGLALAFEHDLPRLREENYLDPEFCNNRITDVAIDYIDRGHPAPMLILGNCHDETINFLHVEINGMVASIKLRHDLGAAEELRFLVNRNDSHTPWRVTDLNWAKMSVMETTIGKNKWIIGTDIEKVHLKVQEKLAEQSTRLTKAEVSSQIQEQTAAIQQKLTDTEAVTDNIRKELRLTKDELANTKLELSRANDISRGTFEQQQLAMKMAMQTSDQQFALQKQELEKERLATLLAQAQIKTNADLAVATAKVQKEAISVQGAEASNFGTIAKTVTVIAPIAAAAAAWMHQQKAASGLCALVGGISGAGILPAVVAIGAIALLAKPVVSVVKHSINVISSKARQFWSWLTS